MFRKGNRVRSIAIMLAIVFGLLLLIYYATTGVGSDSSTAKGALIGAQVETGTPVTTLPKTITMIVTGSRSEVTYNNGHRAIQVKGPFQITLPMSPGRNYSIASFNLHPGNSQCTIKFGTKEIAVSKALGQAQTAGCVATYNKTRQTWIPSSW